MFRKSRRSRTLRKPSTARYSKILDGAIKRAWIQWHTKGVKRVPGCAMGALEIREWLQAQANCSEWYPVRLVEVSDELTFVEESVYGNFDSEFNPWRDALRHSVFDKRGY